jgi:hypothetical protein
MTQDQDFIRIRNISLIIFLILAILSVIIYFLFPQDISLAVIISSLLAYLVFVATLLYYRWVSRKSMQGAAKSVIISFAIKLLFLGACFYLINRLGIVNGMIFAVSFVVFFTIFLNIEIFLIYKKLLFK